MIGYDNLMCNVAMLWLLLTCFFALFFFLKSLFFFLFFGMATYAKCTNQDSNCVYLGTILWHKGRYDDAKMIPIWYGMYAMEGVDQWSLMCTSNVAGNTQMASLDRQVTQNGLGGYQCNCKGNIQRRGTTIPRWYGGYRPWRWWVVLFLI